MNTEELDGPTERAFAEALRGEPETWTPDCLDPERIIALAERSVPERDAAPLMAHIALCARCRREYAETVELMQLSEEVHAAEAAAATPAAATAPPPRPAETPAPEPVLRTVRPQQPPFWQRWFPMGMGFALGAAAAGVAVFFGLAMPIQGERDRLAAEVTRAEGERTALQARVDDLARQAQGQTSQLAKELERLKSRAKQDEVRMARLEQDAATLRELPLPTPGWLVAQESGRVRGTGGGPESGPEIPLVRPANTAVREPKPVLEFRPVAGATGYQVSLELEGSNEEVPAPRAVAPGKWQVTAPLQLGKVYQWAVSAQKKDQPLRSPLARFYVLSDAERREVESARKQYAKDPLTLGAVYARLGLLSEAEEQFRAALKADPKDPVATRWVKQIASRK